ncbi:MAG: hypothetical protein AAGB12_05265 [Pseudomonadota bacterium]
MTSRAIKNYMTIIGLSLSLALISFSDDDLNQQTFTLNAQHEVSEKCKDNNKKDAEAKDEAPAVVKAINWFIGDNKASLKFIDVLEFFS